jgi:hypothetical protein
MWGCGKSVKIGRKKRLGGVLNITKRKCDICEKQTMCLGFDGDHRAGAGMGLRGGYPSVPGFGVLYCGGDY